MAENRTTARIIGNRVEEDRATNEALKPLCLALAPRAAAEHCLASAAAVDTELERVPSHLIEAIQATPNQFRFPRSLHRNDHLNDFEHLLHLHQGRESV